MPSNEVAIGTQPPAAVAPVLAVEQTPFEAAKRLSRRLYIVDTNSQFIGNELPGQFVDCTMGVVFPHEPKHFAGNYFEAPSNASVPIILVGWLMRWRGSDDGVCRRAHRPALQRTTLSRADDVLAYVVNGQLGQVIQPDSLGSQLGLQFVKVAAP